MDLIRSISWISSSHLRLVRDDDSHIDRLSHRYTVAICVLFAIIVSTKQYAGDPIDCWVPAQFKASYEKYADSYCWIAGSWYTPMDKELPLNERERRNQRIRYYQWVPFLLLFQAILCYIPRIIWRSFNVRSGLDLVNLVDAAIKYESVDKFTDREKIMAYIVRNIERYIGARKSRYERLYGRQLCLTHNPKRASADSNKQQAILTSNRNTTKEGCCNTCCSRLRIVLSTMCFWTGKRLGNYLVVLYMFVKTLWLTNAVSQLFLLNRFIGNDYHAFGVEIIEMLLSGQEWHELRHFPRVTYCDFKIREIGNSHDWTVQCVLRINLFNEVIYIFMWFWLCILALCSLVDYFTWTFRILIPADKLRFVKRHLDIYNYYLPESQQKNSNTNNPKVNDFEYIDVEKEKKLMKEFTFNYLKDDGVFAMRIMASSASDLIVTEIMSELWKNFKNTMSETSLGDDISQSSSSSTSISQGSSAVSTPIQQQGTLKKQPPPQQQSPPQQHKNNNNNNQAGSYSPTNIIKKPFNYGGNNIKVQYSPTSQHQQNINSIYSNAALINQKSQLNNNNNSNSNSPEISIQPPPPVPCTTVPHLSGINSNSFDETNKKPIMVKDVFPHIQQTQIVQQAMPHLQHSNINANAKDTHV